MDFFKKIFGWGAEKKEAEELSLTLDDANDLLERKFDDHFKPFRKNANKIYERMRSASDGIQESLERLERARFTERADPRLLQNAMAHKKSFIKKMRDMLNQVDKPIGPDFDSILEFHESSSSAISEANKKTVKDYHFLKRLFEREASGTIEIFKELDKLSGDLGNLIKNQANDIFSLRNIRQTFRSLEKEMENLRRKESQLTTLKEKLSELEAEYDVARKKLRKLKVSEERSKFEEMLERKRNIEEEISELESEIHETFSRVKRPFRKFRHLVETGGKKVGELKLYMDSPAEKLINLKDASVVNSILKKVRASVISDEIRVEEKGKVLDEIDQLIESNIFQRLVERYDSLLKERARLKKRISEETIQDKIDEAGDDVKAVKRKVESAKLKIEKVNKQLNQMRDSVVDEQIDLENMLEPFTGRKVELDLK